MSALRPIMAKGAASSLPLDLALDIIPSLPRPLLARMVAKMIDRLDAMDGDPDLEGQHDEDDLTTAFFLVDRTGPGCPISDPGGQCDEDGASTELGHVIASQGAGCDISDCDVDEAARELWETVDGRKRRAYLRKRLGLPPDRPW